MSTISASVRLTERNDAETRQLRQSAADALQSYSVLALHSLADNEPPAMTRIRMLRYLTGIPQTSFSSKRRESLRR
ncbi:hypothetical protein K450DRAFT_263380 [Umbelopsis ramanniana AG]|uniref:Uncharacterized protein n=1 Tax=Umbelopsis ramanniana AG TaxID=1314678 RepID=A0AAD5E070_UMBRA|nr:uncharacterized protein K450DRAFT_263380 [Umbelopsis ramanniana AG]KAI8575078.1 hypothetical protein K450DRAFT_263380 [Umbelopsis ramanniana AG]